LPELISLTFTYRRDEYVRAMRRHYSRTLHGPHDVAAAIIAVVGGLWISHSHPGTLSTMGSALVVLGFALGTFVALALLVSPRLAYASQPKLKQQYNLVFSDAGIAFRTASIDAKLDWSIYRRWVADDDFYYLYHGKREFSVIPQRVFPDDSVACAFRDLLMRKIGAPARDRSSRTVDKPADHAA
jgi:hypothetical protein